MSDLITTALERFQRASDVESPQRQRELQALRFEYDPWPQGVKEARAGYTQYNVPVPPRPMLNIPMVDQPIQLVINQEKAAHLGIEIHPESEDADDDTAAVLQGLIRHIEVKSRANLARSWAFERCVKAGRGFYRITKQWANTEVDGPEAYDQELVPTRILNQASVYIDPDAQEPDFSDMKWAFITQDLSKEQYKEQFPKSKLAKNGPPKISGNDFQGIGDAMKTWLAADTYRIAEYFTVETSSRMRVAHGDPEAPQFAWEDELPEDFDASTILNRRPKDTRTVLWRKINAVEVLEEVPWDGQYIPIIAVVSRESNIDGERRWTGVIEPAMDAARFVNYTASSIAEKIAIDTKTPWILWEGQEEGHEAEIVRASARPVPFVRFKPTALNGEVLGQPQRNVAGPNLQADLVALQEAKEFVHAATFTFDPSLGRQSPKDRSGKAILAQQQQADQSHSHYLDNLSNISLTYEAKIYLDMIPRVYDRPGRITQILNGKDERETVLLNQPFYRDAQQRPRPLPPSLNGTPSVPPLNPATGKPAEVLHYDLQRGRYGVVVSVGRSYQTKLQQGQDALGQLMQAEPQLIPIIGWRYFKYNDNIPGHNEIADDLKKLRPPPLQDEPQGPDPKMLLGQLQQLQQALQQAQQEIQTDRAKQQAQIEIAQINASLKMQVERLHAETQIAVAEINKRADVFQQERDRIGLQLDGQADRTHDALQNERDRQHEAMLAQLGHQQALEQGQQQAALTPPPMNGNGAP